MEDTESQGAPAGSVIRVRFSYPDVETFARKTVRMISRGGLFLPTREMRPEGSTVRFECLLGDGTPVIRGEGKVLWVRAPEPEQPQRTPGLGLELAKLDSKGRAVVNLVLKLAEVDALSRAAADEGQGAASEPAEPEPPEPAAPEPEPPEAAAPEPEPPEPAAPEPEAPPRPAPKKPSRPPPLPTDALLEGIRRRDRDATPSQPGPLALASALPTSSLLRMTKKGEADAALKEVLAMSPAPDDEPEPVEPPPPPQPPPPPRAPAMPPPIPEDARARPAGLASPGTAPEVPIYIDGAAPGDPSIPFSLDAPDDWQGKSRK